MSAATDSFGLRLTTTSDEAVAHYRAGVETLLAANGDAAKSFQQALALDPKFALAHAGLATALLERNQPAEALAARERARAMAVETKATEREVSHIAALEGLAGRTENGARLAEEHLATHPKDALVVELLGGYFFFDGGPDKKTRALQLFQNAAAHFSDHWFISGRLGFHLQEAGSLDEALPILERALEQNPQNANAAHGYVHALRGTGKVAEAERFLHDWIRDYSRDGRLHAHLEWHLSLDALDRMDPAAAFERLRPELTSPRGPRALALADAVGLLWRLFLDERPEANEGFQAVASLARELAKKPGRPFVDMHLAALFAALQDRTAFDALTTAAAKQADTDAFIEEVALPSYRGLWAFGQGDYKTVVDLLWPLYKKKGHGSFEGFGGSNVERALFTETLLEAALRMKKLDVAKKVLASFHNRQTQRGERWVSRMAAPP